MCTVLNFTTKNRYIGRNLDIDRSYGEEICIVPRRFVFCLKQKEDMREHYAIMGMATVAEGAPLFYDAVNEHGLCMAGLNFPENAHYAPPTEDKDNIAPFELIPWILGQCATACEAKALLLRLNIAALPFSEQLPLAPLHWLVSGKDGDIVVEAMRDGLHIYNNPVGVLTNNPPFTHQLANLRRYAHLCNDNAAVSRAENPEYSFYSQGLGAVGLPGDVSSESRFVRAAFLLKHAACDADEQASVSQVFHLLSSVGMVRGACKTDSGTWDITAYSACINADKGLYYYTTYENRAISCVNMHKTDLNSSHLTRFPLVKRQNVLHQN